MVISGGYVSKWRAHLLFGGAFLAAITFSVVVNMVAGEPFPKAAWTAVREIRPAEIVMFVVVWYCAFYPPKDEWRSSFTTLNLGSKDEKDT